MNLTISGPVGAPPLVLSNELGTTAAAWDPQLEELERRLTVIRYEHALRGSVAELAEPLLEAQPFLDMQLAFAREDYALGLEAIGGFDFRERLGEIQAPTLAITGADDTATTLEDGAALVNGIPDSRLMVLEHAAHLANVEAPRAFTLAVLEHLW
jgi:pimeloyl-ACP methyl ester carboxylesterase